MSEPTPTAENVLPAKAYLRWNDPTLDACERAVCVCGHEALDHAWHGCDRCSCTASAIHAVLASGAVAVSVIVPVEPLACNAQGLRHDGHDWGFGSGETFRCPGDPGGIVP